MLLEAQARIADAGRGHRGTALRLLGPVSCATSSIVAGHANGHPGLQSRQLCGGEEPGLSMLQGVVLPATNCPS